MHSWKQIASILTLMVLVGLVGCDSQTGGLSADSRTPNYEDLTGTWNFRSDGETVPDVIVELYSGNGGVYRSRLTNVTPNGSGGFIYTYSYRSYFFRCSISGSYILLYFDSAAGWVDQNPFFLSVASNGHQYTGLNNFTRG